MADARRRAVTYAQATDLSLGEVLEVVEVGAEQAGRAMHKAHGAVLSGYSPTLEMPVHSEGLEIVVGVQVTYALVSRSAGASANSLIVVAAPRVRWARQESA